MKLSLEELLTKFTTQTKTIFGENLIGIYLHGSAAMNCFNPEKSDIDLLLVVKHEIPETEKLDFMNMVVSLNKEGPSKGIELSIVKESVCKPFIYPTPFKLHFSEMHLNWFNTNPTEYVEKMNGVDKDLAAHFTIINHRGKTLYGKSIQKVFSEVDSQYYLDSILEDINDAKEDVLIRPMYSILTMNRVLAYKRDNLILSKKEGGRYGLFNIPKKFHSLLQSALDEYENNIKENYPKDLCLEYIETMQKLISEAEPRHFDFSEIIGKEVSGHIDRPLNSAHPRHPEMIYPINYGYVDNVFAPDGAEQDVYVFGTDRPITEYCGKVIAVYHRFDDIEDKWIVSIDNKNYSDQEIINAIHFQEQYFIGKLFR